MDIHFYTAEFKKLQPEFFHQSKITRLYLRAHIKFVWNFVPSHDVLKTKSVGKDIYFTSVMVWDRCLNMFLFAGDSRVVQDSSLFTK